MTPVPVPRTRTDETNVLTISEVDVARSDGIESVTHASESAARAYRPSWFNDPWYPTPALTKAVVSGRTMDDFVVPGVHKLINEGVVIPSNPLSYKERIYVSDLATFGVCGRRVYRSSGVWRTQWTRVQWFARPLFNEPALPQPDLNRLTAARASMQSGYMDALTFVAEFHKTVELITKFRQRVLTSLDDMVLAWSKRQKRPFRTYSQAFESLSAFWLEWRFGWRILMYDYEGIVAAINDLDGSLLRKPFRDRSVQESSSTTRKGYNPFAMSGTLVLRRDLQTTVQFSGGCLGDGRLSAATIDPLVTAWELLPLSLVLDMFWNLGDWLTANSPFATVEEVDAWTSVYRNMTETLSFEYIPPTAADCEVMKQLQPVGAASVLIQKSRQLQLNTPTPIYPEINLSPGKIFDLVAISFILRKLVLRRVKFLSNRG